MGEERPGECSGSVRPEHIYGCRSSCSPSPAVHGPGAIDRAGAEEFVQSVQSVRLLHPYVIAYPLDGAGDPVITTDKASIFPNQFATKGDDGFGWNSPLSGSNDTISTTDTWALAWDTAARHGGMTVWVGDVVMPKNWIAAAERSAQNPNGTSCGGAPVGWSNANDYTTYLNVALAKLSALYGNDQLPVEALALYPAMPYVRASSSAATLLKRFQARHLADEIEPQRFSTSGNSKGGFGCTYATAADPRITLGVCGVFDIFDWASPTSAWARFITDWGLCETGGRDGDGCVSGNMPASPGAAGTAQFMNPTNARESLLSAWEPARFLPWLERIGPKPRFWWHNASTDFHYPAGLNDGFWGHPLNGAVDWRLYQRINADHGGFSLMPDDGPEGLSGRDWVHGPDKWMSYRSFYADTTPAAVHYLNRPAVETVAGVRSVVARVRANSARGIAGVRAFVAAGTDRDFSACSGMEGLAEAGNVRCLGLSLCRSIEPVCNEVEGPDETASCPGGALNTRVQKGVVLPLRNASSSYCRWRHDQSGVSLWRQCVDPLAEGLNGSEAPHQRIERRVGGTYTELGWTFPTASAGAVVPRLAPYAAVGEDRPEQLFADYGFVSPYTRDGEAFRYWDSGFFVPRSMAVTQQADGSVIAELRWTIPAGSPVDHFAVTVEAWDTPPAGDRLPDIVFTDVATVAPIDDPTIISCE
jgi:hypothetical protein